MDAEDLTSEEAAAIYAVGYHHILQMDEGLIVEYQDQMFVITKSEAIDDGQTIVSIDTIDPSEGITQEDCENIAPGRWIWMHDKIEEN